MTDDPVECETCAEHHGLVDEDMAYCISALMPMFNKQGYKLVQFSVPEPRCPVGGMHMAKATEDACPACAADLPVQGEPHP